MNILDVDGFVTTSVFSTLEKLTGRRLLGLETITQAVAELIRFNTLLSVARAGTGHLGASLSIVELLAEIYFRSFTFNPKKKNDHNRDIFILSKGHAAPCVYATLAAKGYIPTSLLDKLRRWGGLEGHCDITTPGIEANTGSLAMGLSKAVGFAIAKKRFKWGGNVITVVGDGELQEGQCWEAFLSAVSFGCDNLYVVIDDNQVQTDQYTKKIVHYGKLIKAFSLMGFDVFEGKGDSVRNVHKAFLKLKAKRGRPKLFYAHTKKGQGVSFMEHTQVLRLGNDRYIWHNKAPSREQLKNALTEVLGRAAKILKKTGFRWDLEKATVRIPIEPMQQGIAGKSLVAGFSSALEKLGKKHKNIVVVDGDLEEDCGFIPFHKTFPKRFFEMGIMEQHMTGTVCALSRLGFIPVISSYAAFLTSRANEQLYNLATERTRAIVVGNMAGILPATPGKSHQAFRDIACMKNIPGFFMYQPVSDKDTENVLERYFAKELGNLLYLRLSMAASRVEVPTPPILLPVGHPHIIKEGNDVLLVGIGPVVLGECIRAAQVLDKEGIKIAIWNHPWLNNFSVKFYEKVLRRDIPLVIVEDHFHLGGFGESFLSNIATMGLSLRPLHIAIRDFPRTGFRQEALEGFGLDFHNIAAKVRALVG